MHTTTPWVHYMGVALPLHVEPAFYQLWLLIWFNYCTQFHSEQKHVTPCNNLLTITAWDFWVCETICMYKLVHWKTFPRTPSHRYSTFSSITWEPSLRDPDYTVRASPQQKKNRLYTIFGWKMAVKQWWGMLIWSQYQFPQKKLKDFPLRII